MTCLTLKLGRSVVYLQIINEQTVDTIALHFRFMITTFVKYEMQSEEFVTTFACLFIRFGATLIVTALQ